MKYLGILLIIALPLFCVVLGLISLFNTGELLILQAAIVVSVGWLLLAWVLSYFRKNKTAAQTAMKYIRILFVIVPPLFLITLGLISRFNAGDWVLFQVAMVLTVGWLVLAWYLSSIEKSNAAAYAAAQKRKMTLYTMTPVFTAKKCTNCGRQVPAESHSGQRCPHCGVYWSSDNTVTEIHKQCGNCDKKLSMQFNIGDKCPDCKVEWVYADADRFFV